MKRDQAGREGVGAELHLHSRASGMASNWWVKGLGVDVEARESYTPPEKAYKMAKGAGMDFVTLTDHETIEGALTLTGHPDFFVGEEISARFPEDENYADILVYGLDARIHSEAQSRRDDIYGLVDYLREEGVVHALAHPVYAMPGPLDRDQMEKRLVLFGLWEFINGSRPEKQNRLARDLAETVGPIELRQLSMRHGLPAPPHRSISGTAGSDDHGGIYGGATHTAAPRASGPRKNSSKPSARVRSGPEARTGRWRRWSIPASVWRPPPSKRARRGRRSACYGLSPCARPC